MKKLSLYTVLLSSTFLLSACGGGGGGTTPPPVVGPPPPPPVTTSVTSAGPISGFGSIIVNGVTYNTDGADFTINDASGTQADLKVGHIITLKATTDAQGNATAQQVFFDDVVTGPIAAIDLANNIVTVLGQTVFVVASTSFEDGIVPTGLAGLAVGNIIEVSGEFDANGDIVASRIELEPAGTEFEVHGIVANLDTAASTFSLGQQNIDYAAAVFVDFGTASIANGDFVEAKGSTINGAGALVAREVELEGNDDLIGDENDDGEINGFVTAFTSSSSFTVGSVPVVTTGSTTYVYGVAEDIMLNVRVEVEGSFNADGELVATEVKFDQEANIEIAATLDAVDAANNTITIFGVEFNVDISTRFEDNSEADLTTFGLSDLAAGDYLEVRGFDRTSDGLYASKIERDDAEEQDTIQAFVETIDVGASTLVMLGITIETNVATTYEDTDAAGLPETLTEAEFFARVASGDLIEAEGVKTQSGTLLAEELSFERPDDD